MDRGRALCPRRRPRPARALRRVVAGERAAAGRRGRCPHARPRATRPAGHRHRDPHEEAARRMRPRASSQRRTPSPLARATGDDLSAGVARRDGRNRTALHIFAGRAALRVSRGNRAAGRDAGVAPAQVDRRRARAPLSRRRSGRCARPDRARACIDRRASLRALLPHRPRHRRVRAIEGHPLPGPWLGGELGGLLRARHHRGRSVADVDAVRALHQQGAQRAARHRRRLRAPAAGRSDAVRLRQVRSRSRRARRNAHHLPAEERGARRRQGARARPRAGRSARRRVRVVGRSRGGRRSASARRASRPTIR